MEMTTSDQAHLPGHAPSRRPPTDGLGPGYRVQADVLGHGGEPAGQEAGSACSVARRR